MDDKSVGGDVKLRDEFLVADIGDFGDYCVVLLAVPEDGCGATLVIGVQVECADI